MGYGKNYKKEEQTLRGKRKSIKERDSIQIDLRPGLAKSEKMSLDLTL